MRTREGAHPQEGRHMRGRDDTHIGFVGLGNLGQAMALRLARDGWTLSVLDRDPGKCAPCAAEGARVVTSASELADCDVIALAVPDDKAVAELLSGSTGLIASLRPGSTVLVHSTVLPVTARMLAEEAASREIDVLDAPVSGGADRALAGTLTVMVGGDSAVLDAARPVLECVGREIQHLGPSGAGAATKLANQLLMFASLAAAHEAADLAAAYGVAEEALFRAVATGTGASWITENWGFFDGVAAAYEAGGTQLRDRTWTKDTWEIVAAARQADLRMPLAGLLSQYVAERVEDHARQAREASSRSDQARTVEER
ncbi:NAD(P)-dependent oxidoreductase [Blastococcus sp. CT_GayMR20]|uniref:NAD(P)-dependent oxidoreductase n=1 Tax=Blastococcus sp. CT_GayMR20 TaxID=2559609 RepID=UPI001073A07C|nr:NAD(P)-dependent oxidoreductase [Blastococcus sp. CT_GayMR20]TFV70580.1 NAD(P)-dependent oxidoreductase [Blastococcus sp. CT_GayMR20]